MGRHGSIFTQVQAACFGCSSTDNSSMTYVEWRRKTLSEVVLMRNTRCLGQVGALIKLMVNMLTAASKTSFIPRKGSLVQQEPKKDRRQMESLHTAQLQVE